MTSLQNQIIKYREKHIGSARRYFFRAWKGRGQFVPPVCVGAADCAVKCESLSFGFQNTALCFMVEVQMEEANQVELRPAVKSCRN